MAEENTATSIIGSCVADLSRVITFGSTTLVACGLSSISSTSWIATSPRRVHWPDRWSRVSVLGAVRCCFVGFACTLAPGSGRGCRASVPAYGTYESSRIGGAAEHGARHFYEMGVAVHARLDDNLVATLGEGGRPGGGGVGFDDDDRLPAVRPGVEAVAVGSVEDPAWRGDAPAG